MKIEIEEIKRINKIYKKNIKEEAKKNKNLSLKELSINLGYSGNYISNACNKENTIISSNLIYKISICLSCSMKDLNEGL